MGAEDTAGQEPASLRELLRPVLDRWKWITAAVVLAAALTYLYYAAQPDEYTASTTVYLRPAGGATGLLTPVTAQGSDRIAENQARLATSRPVIERAATELDDFDAGAIDSAVTAIAAEGADFLTVSATRGDPEEAAVIANAVADAFVAEREATQRGEIERAIDTTRAELDRLEALGREAARQAELQARIERLEPLADIAGADATVTERASTPGSPSNPSPLRNAAFALFLALLGAVGLSYLLARFDRRVKTVDDVSEAFSLPLLASVPHVEIAPDGRLTSLDVPQLREPFRSLRTNLKLASFKEPLKTILVTSAMPGEGKSTTVCNLAIAYRELGARVAVVDMDLRRPSLARLMSVQATAGIVEVLSAETSLEEALHPVTVAADGAAAVSKIESAQPVGSTEARSGPNGGADTGSVRLLPVSSRPADPEAVLGTDQMRGLIEQLAADYDIVLLDTPPLLTVSDTALVAGAADGLVIVARMGLTTRDAGKRMSAYLERVPGAKPVGIVANDVPQTDLGYEAYGYYTYAPDPSPR